MITSTPGDVVLAACDIDKAEALVPVAQAFIEQGYHVTVLLDKNQSAGTRGGLSFSEGCTVHLLDVGSGFPEGRLHLIREAAHVLVTLSPTTSGSTVETGVFNYRKLTLEKPIFGYSEVPCGHRAPAWDGTLAQFDKLFVAKKTDDISSLRNAVEVGMAIPEFDRERAAQTLKKLKCDRLVWYVGGPYEEAVLPLQYVIQACRWVERTTDDKATIVFSRHSRDPKRPFSRQLYQSAVDLAEFLDVPIIENSGGYTRDETTSKQLEVVVWYADLFQACMLNGVIVTGHGTDGIKAPWCGIPSILCVGSKLNPHIVVEKGCAVLPLPHGYPAQVTELEEVESAVVEALTCDREDFMGECREMYPLSERSPAQIIVETMLA